MQHEKKNLCWITSVIMIWKDSSWILKSHFIATSKSSEWLCMEPSELHTFTHITKGRDSQTWLRWWEWRGAEDPAWTSKAPRMKIPFHAPSPPCLAVLLDWLSLELGSELFEWRDLVIFIFIPLALIPMPGKYVLPEFAEWMRTSDLCFPVICSPFLPFSSYIPRLYLLT